MHADRGSIFKADRHTGTFTLEIWRKTPEIRGFPGIHGYCLEGKMVAGEGLEPPTHGL